MGIKHGKLFSFIPPVYIHVNNGGKLSFGYNLSLNHNVTLDASDFGEIIIGNNVSIGMNTVLRASNHNYIRMKGHVSGKIVIGDNVWIAANCVILPDVAIQSGSVIGAGSIVTKDIPENVVAVGNPCKPIKEIVRE
jgi:galactoside O-acetyltransferase